MNSKSINIDSSTDTEKDSTLENMILEDEIKKYKWRDSKTQDLREH